MKIKLQYAIGDRVQSIRDGTRGRVWLVRVHPSRPQVFHLVGSGDEEGVSVGEFTADEVGYIGYARKQPTRRKLNYVLPFAFGEKVQVIRSGRIVIVESVVIHMTMYRKICQQFKVSCRDKRGRKKVSDFWPHSLMSIPAGMQITDDLKFAIGQRVRIVRGGIIGTVRAASLVCGLHRFSVRYKDCAGEMHEELFLSRDLDGTKSKRTRT